MVVYKVDTQSDGPKATPYSWQIYRVDATVPIEQSPKNFRTALLARIAGHRRLDELGLIPKPKAKR